ncbi:MAG TPA: PaaX family transcriptional regulator C-terminal domain-containing protein [Microbacterium sp.]|uniref:PaaX family transcriptional regulator n=1 Tax=Microbacterium sp. TaxID=51671 RepID=UPI002D0AF9F9|nr:PaaX family transcriptional regulator C-terminal domain-containing protein [Microbacterium sp.]HWI31975.1 PaaX family transcriptional regulator C-terminal domain-containing protein [Microbacterium sp.]
MRSRQPKQLLLAFFGEHVVDQDVPALRASALIEVLEGAGVAAPATRATLDRMVRSGLLARERRGREILFSLTGEGAAVLREASERVRGPHPFEPHGSGWTLVTFTVPEDQRTLRHRLRSALSWEGFAPLRDGLWLAPGEVDLAAALEPLRTHLPAAAITAFHARELPGYAMADNVRAAWDIDKIRDEHLAFIDTWSAASTAAEAGSPLSARAMLVADWLALLGADPRLPRAFMDEDWPSDRSFEVYWAAREGLDEASAAQFAALIANGAQRHAS